MPEPLLSFEFADDGQRLEIHGDEAGFLRLQEIIGKLVQHTKPGHFNHDHLMTPEWGGWELSAENKGGRVIHHVKLYCWKGDSFQK